MIKKRNQLITMIATPTIDLKGLYGVLSGAAFGLSFDTHGFDFQGQDSGIGSTGQIDFKALKPDAPKGNLPIA